MEDYNLFVVILMIIANGPPKCMTQNYCSQSGETFIRVSENLALNTLDSNATSQEGRSFCIIPNQLKESDSALNSWGIMPLMKPLLDVNLDIGTHIHPSDYSKMNTEKDNPKCGGREGYANRPALPEFQPDENCQNPYKAEVTEIIANGVRLHNWLHIKVYAEELERQKFKNCPEGKIRYLLLEVRDQGGFPVGEFTDEVPCDANSTETLECPLGLKCSKYTGTRENYMPCMFNPLRAILHPGIFIMAVEDSAGTNDSSTTASPGASGGGAVSTTGAPSNATATASYVTEVHISWKFAQHSSSLITELHFSALILESTTLIDYFTGRRHKFSAEHHCSSYTDLNGYTRYPASISSTNGAPTSDWDGCYHSGNDTGRQRMYGYTAQYTVLKPNFKTLGGADYFRRKFIKQKNINCFKPISKNLYYEVGAPWKGILPKHPQKFFNKDQNRAVSYSTTYYLRITPSAYKDLLTRLARDPYSTFMSPYDDITTGDNLEQPATTYFGTKHTKYAYTANYDKVSYAIDKELRALKTLQSQAARERCPCPRLPTTPPPELATRPPKELDGRRLHAVQMLIAWVILIPISIFSSRYYKETFSKVFFLQEFWWYTVHVLSLFTAMIFMFGGIYALEIKKSEGGIWVTPTWFHVILGSVTMGLFFIHLFLGFLRAYNVRLRLIQIMLHWLVGWTEYLMASATILISGSIPQGFMSCAAIYVYYGFLGFQFIFYIIMEIHMRCVDKMLHLNPPRSYLPPPVMRVFHKNAPWSKFRMYMLLLYTTVCLCVFGGMHVMMAIEGNEGSCYQKVKEQDIFLEI